MDGFYRRPRGLIALDRDRILSGYGLVVLGISYYFRDRIGALRWLGRSVGEEGAKRADAGPDMAV